MKSTCPYCLSKKYVKKYSTFDIFDNDYELVKCRNCNAYFLTPNPDDDLLKKAYDESYYGGEEDDEKFEGFIEKGVNYFRKRRANKLAQLINNKGKILDIGCGNGQFLEMLSVLGDIEIYGTEMEGSSAKRAAKIKNINLKIGALSKDDYQKEYFDAITMFHVFEHLNEPSQYLDIIEDILKSNGYLVMSFPNIDSWQARFFKGHWLHLDPPRHLFFYKPNDFKKLMKDRGFELLRENYISVEQNPFGAIQSWFNLFHVKREIFFESLKGNFEYVKETHSLILFLERILFIFLTPIFIFIDVFVSFFKKSATVEFVFKKKT